MFSKKMILVVGMFVVMAVNTIVLSVNKRHNYTSSGLGEVVISFIAPFQEVVSHSIRFARDIWTHYFFLVSVAKENDALKRSLSLAIEKNNACNEIELSNFRLRALLNFQKAMTSPVLSAEVIGKDPSPWFKTIIIDKGKADGIEKGLPVVVPEGIAGQVADVSYHYSKVLLIIDQNNAVDALVERIRARGIITGESSGRCAFKYVLRKHDIKEGDTIVSSGLDGVFPKGIRVGYVSEVAKRTSGIFQDVKVTPYVDFEKLEEVLVVLNTPRHKPVDE
jgi:rod shape-determining protein MreC